MKLAGMILLIGIVYTNSAHAMPSGMSPGCQSEYQKYLAAPLPKAFARGAARGCGWSGNDNRGSRSKADVQQRALDFCGTAGNTGCRIIESVDL
jgi:hypothetical protein